MPKLQELKHIRQNIGAGNFIIHGILCAFFMLLHFQVQSQDTLAIYYTGGEHRLSPENKLLLSDFIYSNDLSFIDSISLVGYANPTGNQKKNLKLSKKRADQVFKYLSAQLSDTLHFSSQAKGEELDETKAHLNHRRVEVVLYFKYVPPSTNNQEEDFKRDSLSKNCYILADSIMDRCKISYLRKGNMQLVNLELETHHYNEKNRVYTMSAKTRYVKQVKWKLEQTGQWWWKRNRYIATVRASDFNAFGLLGKIPPSSDTSRCIVCDADNGVNWHLQTTVKTEAFIMQNLQLRRKLLDDDYLVIVPREYVNLTRSYFFDPEKEYPVQWFTKMGRKNAGYLFAQVPTALIANPNWSVYSYHLNCSNTTDGFVASYNVDTLLPHRCSPNTSNYSWFTYGLEAAYMHFDNRSALFGAYGQLRYNRQEGTVFLGTDLATRPTIGIKYDFHLFAYAPLKESYIAKTNRALIEEIHRTINGYVGTGIHAIIDNATNPIVHDLHLGIAYRNNGFSFCFDQLFIESGVSFNYTSLNSGPQLYLKTGFRFKI